MFFRTAAIAAAASLAAFSSANAALVTFTATGNANVSGYVQFDDSSFDGTSSQFVSNSEIVDLSLTAFGEVFTLADVITTADTIINSAGLVPIIVNGAGELANNGSFSISFFPDDYQSSGADGDASLEFGEAFYQGDYYAVQWVADVSDVPLPAALPLFLAGFAGVGAAARKRRKKAA